MKNKPIKTILVRDKDGPIIRDKGINEIKIIFNLIGSGYSDI
tara:strand:+ start:360 stop:485 length:126 start_codon:yes stop_codon:yes gene_type:complete